MKSSIALILILLLGSCVSRGKYNKLLDEIRLKEKQNIKLQTQADSWKEKNEKLKDSAERIK